MIDVTKLLAELVAARKIVEAAREVADDLLAYPSTKEAKLFNAVKEYDKELGE